MNAFLKRYCRPWWLIVIFFILFFRKIIHGLIPIPFDLLVQWFFPYSQGGWQADGYWTAYKGGHFASDAIRQLYPWRDLAIELIKDGQLPLWNPYNFSGTPLLANMQSAVFYPFNLLFFVIPSFPLAWGAYVALPILLTGIFMYLFLNSIGLEKLSAVLGSLAFASSGYMVSWLEWGVIPHTVMWLPLLLFAVNKWFLERKKRYLLLLTFTIAITILAGYPPGAAQSFMILFCYIAGLLFYQKREKIIGYFLPLISCFILAVGITSIQWLPTAELYFNSAMKGEVSQKLSREAAMPLFHFATIFAPDYFGNRATDNYWAKTFSNLDYMDADLYIGVVSLPLVFFALLQRKKRKIISWLLGIACLGIAIGAESPVSALIAALGIPVISTGAAAEALFMLIFTNCCLAAFGINFLSIKFDRKIYLAIGVICFFYLLLFATGLFLKPEYASISRRNLILPVTFFLTTAMLIIIYDFKIFSGKILKLMLITLLGSELLLHANKILPFSSFKFAFPKHVMIEELKQITGHSRVDGFWETEIATDFHTAFRLKSLEGYDPLYIRRYGELVTSAKSGNLTKDIPRSDADLTMNNESNRNRLLDLTSVKYIVAKVTDPNDNWEQEPLKYNPERFKIIWQDGNFKIYENFQALPRVNLYSQWQVIGNDEDIIKTLYSSGFDPKRMLILEKDPKIKSYITGIGEAQLLEYKANRVTVYTTSDHDSILLLTDSYYPGWSAEVDGKKAEIIRANYNFKSIALPAGKHTVTFIYLPDSFVYGAVISVICLITVFIFSFIFGKNKE